MRRYNAGEDRQRTPAVVLGGGLGESRVLSPETASASYKWQVQAVVGVGTLMATLDGSITSIALPTIAQEFGVNLVTVSWVTLVYMLTMTSLLLTLGSLADRYGRKRLYNLGLVVFTVGSLFCSFAWSIWALVAARALQAVGGAMMVGNSAAVLTQAFPARERGRTLGLNSTVVALGLSAGPTLGGLLISAFNWRSIFYVNLPIGVLGTFLAYRLLREEQVSHKGHAFDSRGALLLIGSLLSLTLGLTQTDTLGWGSPLILGAFALALALGIAFVFTEQRAEHPLVRLSLFRNRLFAAANITAMLSFLASNCYLFIMPFFLQTVLNLIPAQAGLVMSTVPATVFFVAAFSGWLSDRVDSVYLSSAGMAIVALGYWSLVAMGPDVTPTGVALRLVVVGVGSGLFQSPNTRAVMSSTPKRYLGVGSGMIALMRNLGMVTGVSLGSSVFAARQAFYLTQPSAVAAGSGAAAFAFRFAFRDAIVIAAAICVVGVFTSLIRGRGRGIAEEGELGQAAEAS